MKPKRIENLSRKVTSDFVSRLEEIVGKENVNTDEMDRMLYSHDLAPLPKEAGLAFKNIPDVVVRPSTVEEISEIVKLAYRNGVAITPRGASTWGLGGSMPTEAGMLIDMSAKMNQIYEVDTVNMSMKVGAGCTWKAAMEAAEKEGYMVGSYPSSFPSATVGGWVSTSGIGPGGYKFGGAAENILNLEVVLPDGTVVVTGFDKLSNNMSGYNLNKMFSGAEGTLGVIATVTLRIHPKGEIRPLAYSFENLRDIGAPINELVHHPSVKPIHIAWSDYLHFENQRKAGIDVPAEIKNLWLVTLQGDKEFVDLEEKYLDGLAAKYGGVKMSADIAAHEWSERCYEFRARKVGVGSIPAEVVVPVVSWSDFVDECYKGFEVMKMEAGGIIGMIADRSTAMFMPYYFKDDETLLGMAAFSFNFYLGERAAEYGGRNLGFGVFFAYNLELVRDKGSLELMRDLKTFMDPVDVMNPGHLVTGKTRFGISMNKKLMSLGSVMMQGAKKLLPQDANFAKNAERFKYSDMDVEMEESRVVTYGDGTQ
ncbi:MAG: FAD-binding oxidoreductase [Thermoplasmatales archaeon]|nr:FAD-binding oxidoreductase [Thermoplasmatales archaeon]